MKICYMNKTNSLTENDLFYLFCFLKVKGLSQSSFIFVILSNWILSQKRESIFLCYWGNLHVILKLLIELERPFRVTSTK